VEGHPWKGFGLDFFGGFGGVLAWGEFFCNFKGDFGEVGDRGGFDLRIIWSKSAGKVDSEFGGGEPKV
jgi:hypothetical protein